MATNQFELSEDGKKRLEEITLAAFHNLMIAAVNSYSRAMDSAVCDVCEMQHNVVKESMDAIKSGKYAGEL